MALMNRKSEKWSKNKRNLEKDQNKAGNRGTNEKVVAFLGG